MLDSGGLTSSHCTMAHFRGPREDSRVISLALTLADGESLDRGVHNTATKTLKVINTSRLLLHFESDTPPREATLFEAATQPGVIPVLVSC